MDKNNQKGQNKNSKVPASNSKGYKLIKKRRKSVFMPEAKYDGAFGKENPYYIKIANRYRIAKYITILLTVVFSLTMLTVFSTDITAENFQYLIKDLDIAGITSGGKFERVIYTGGSSFGIYKGELAVVNSGSTMLYKPSGAVSFNQLNDFYNPCISVSDKYFMVYDRGETSCSYSIYNSFAALHEGKFEYPITTADVSDNGAYAVVTRDDSFRSIVYVYDRNFKVKNEIKKDKYVTSVEMTENGQKLAIASVYDKEGAFESEIQVIKTSDDKAQFTVSESGTIPISVQWLSNGNLGVVFSDRAIIYSEKGEKVNKIDLSNRSALSFDFSSRVLCTVYNTTVIGYDNTVDVYDVNGDLVYSMPINGELIRIRADGNNVCLLFENRVVLVDVNNMAVYEGQTESNPKDILIYNGDVIVCYSGMAEPIALTKK